MAPAKRSKSVNKGFAGVGDFSLGKDEKSKQKKRKLSNMLGSQWSKHELARFYEAYRKYGHDWKKVATFVGSRSIHMVEALYNMNRAYLSLPEGTASVAGLIAMMTDHYNVMGGNGIEKDSNEPLVMARKLQKHPKPKSWSESPIEDRFRRQSIGSSERCISLLKLCLDGIQPFFPVRKRTPRVAVSGLDTHKNKNSRESIMDKNHDALLHGELLHRARQMPSSLQDSQSTYSEIEWAKPSEVLAGEKAISRFEIAGTKHSGIAMDEESADDSLGSSKAKNGDLIRDSLHSTKSVVGECKKQKKKAKKEEVEPSEVVLFDNFTNRGQRGQIGSEGAGAKIFSSCEGARQRNKKPMLEDEQAACDALQTLAEMSLMMPYLSAEGNGDAGESVTRLDAIVDMNSHAEATSKDERADGGNKRKRKSQALKVLKAGLHSDHSRKPAKNEALADVGARSADSSGELTTVSKRHKSSVRSPDMSSGNDQQIREAEVVASSSQAPLATSTANSTRRKHHRKRDRTFLQKDRNYTHSTCSSGCSSSYQDNVQCVKEKISNCLSWCDVRKWCVYEWFYSAIDYPWFAKREFVEYLNHVGLGHIPRLTRVEWGVIRSSLGKPRRFSEHFLQEEREKLKQYRESVRTHYANLRAGLGEGLPTDLARPLSVGQQVVAIHPKTREVHNGSVLTVDHHNCLVQFNRPDLGVELVMDIDCMPVNPLENMPEAMRKQNMTYDCRHLQLPKVNEQFMLTPAEHMQNLHASLASPSFTNETKVKPTCMNTYANLTSSGGIRIPSAAQSHSCSVEPVNNIKGDMRPIPGSAQNLCTKILEQRAGSPNPSYWPRPVATSVGLNGAIYSSRNSILSCQESASNVPKIVDGSRDKAKRMVDIAMKAMSFMKEGEDAYGRIGEALNATHGVQCLATHGVSTSNSPNAAQGTLRHTNSANPCTSEPLATGDVSGIKSASDSSASDLQVPSDLIASCVATLLMIQTCTERQYPPAEVAQILDNAVTSLHPHCSQNLAIYREIQMCMGRIKTQILALVPT